MNKLIICLLTLCLSGSSLYSLHITTVLGSDVDLSSLQGKKLLLVNIATESARANQLVQLQTLRQRYGDSLTIIAFPSNTFGHEPRNNSEIKSVCESIYHTDFLIAQKGPVKGPDIQPVYNWLSNLTENGSLQGEIKSDFQKYLISADGHIIGVFAGSISPLDPMITNAIQDIE